MPQGFSLHIGLNGVDASKYNGWAGTLSGCVNDANSMQAICTAQNFTTQQLLDGDATADAILGNIGQAAYNLQSGDTFVLSYSGHGGQVPDPTGDNPDGLDDTWVAYDRMILGHELYNLWSQFKPNVRIEVYSDSCHSGTVIRDLMLPNGLPGVPARSVPRGKSFVTRDVATRNFKTVYGASPKAADRGAIGAIAGDALQSYARMIPPQLAMQLYQTQRSMYEGIQFSRQRGDITASVILISGCQDNQTSADGNNNGLFTEKLLAVWNSASFSGTLPQFHQAIVALMPSTQTPNYFTVGVDDDTFTNARPLTIVDADAASGAGNGSESETSTDGDKGIPSISGPATFDRTNASPPSFTVRLTGNRYYIVELAADPRLFGTPGGRTPSSWYASWADPSAPARYTAGNYALPVAAWNALKANARLYYRIGTTSSQTDWTNYQVSTTDGDAATSAPSITLSGASGGKDVPFAAYVGTY